MKTFFKNRSFYSVLFSVVLSVVIVAGAAGAATTISTNINTGGTLTVTGATSLNASTTIGSADSNTFQIWANASTTNSFTVNTILYVDGATLLNGNVTLGDAASDVITLTGNATTSNSFQVGLDSAAAANGDLYVSGMATTTGSSGDIATQGTLTVGGDVSGTAVDRIFAGVCNFAATVTISASTTGYVICENATGITETDRVLVMATSSLPENFMIQSASSTPTNGAISVLIYNTGQVAGDVTGVRSLNYWAFR